MRHKIIMTILAFTFILQSWGQTSNTITGVALDADGRKPLASVTVSLLSGGSATSTSTNQVGEFSLRVSEQSGRIRASLVGYGDEEVAFQQGQPVTILMRAAQSELDQVVVVGYGTVKKRDLTGSVVSVKGDEIAKVPSANIIESVQGKVPGVDITRSNGSASAGVNIAVRGNRSITAQNGPLFIVDGVQYSNIQDINPNDIQSMEILKDASSTAIYGSRGANGVIIITTKRGATGKARIDFNAYAGLNQVDRYPSVMDLNQWVRLRREAYRATGRWNSEADDNIVFNDAELAAIRNNEYIDYFDLLVKNGSQQNYQVSVSGGNENTTVYFSGDYLRETGIFERDATDRFGARLNIDQKLGSYFKAGMQANVTRYEIEQRRDPLNQANKINPLGRLRDDDGNLILYPLNGSAISPLADLEPNAYAAQTNRTRVLTNAYVELTGLKGFTARSNIGITLSNSRDGVYAGSYTIDRNGGFSQATYDADNSYLINWENVLTYQKELGDHNFTLSGVNSFLLNRSDNINASGQDLLLDGQLFYALGNARRNLATNTNYVMNNLLSFAGRLNYSFKGKYLLTATGRWDGSSILAKGHQWAFFPSIAAAWRIVDEDFMKEQQLFSELKLRATYGKAGNSAVNPYDTQNSLTRVAFAYDDVAATGYTFSPQIGNPFLGWEITATSNLALDFGFLGNRLNGSIDVYDSRTTDLLLNRGLPPTTGVTSVIQNVGKTRNRGIEVALNAEVWKNTAFGWNTAISFTSNREEIMELVTADDDIGNGWFIGHPTQVFYDYEKLGIWQLGQEEEAARYGQKPGDIRVRDMNGDGQIDATNDRRVLGNPRPNWLAGWDNNFTYKGFDLNIYVFVRWGQMLNPDFLRRYDPQGLGQSTAAIDYWTPENPSNDYPRPNSGMSLGSMLFSSSLGYVDGSFARIRNISLGYTFQGDRLKSKYLRSLRIYGTARNPFTWTRSSLLNEYDPERGGSENFPMTKLFVFGVNVGF
ncbi:SusC/RagA family TonB-linked outer membrane protein [Sphingobacterium paludis]|uniref:TonB-linked SusC/RagA family outer membrane protein n=1 Tax=Sphingobacterium paludis TaxID=1476465 RepID=A0A4V3E2M1_9SPHI|nr:TonB-dependent receptor [Sphingobacterium paludis]TDS17458.1 TonB-linked SusC/RagA family outer membrane protein [Sphingobacterium paludis]